METYKDTIITIFYSKNGSKKIPEEKVPHYRIILIWNQNQNLILTLIVIVIMVFILILIMKNKSDSNNNKQKFLTQ